MFTLRGRSAGVLLHPTSLPGPHGTGDLGLAALKFADFLHDAGQRWWQMLPVVPPGCGDSPYSGLSAFAGNPLLISLETLAEDRGLAPRDIPPPWKLGRGPADFAGAARVKHEAFQCAFDAFDRSAPAQARDEHAAFCQANASWLDDWALFAALRHAHKDAPWWEWEPGVRARSPVAIDAVRREHAQRIRFEWFLQWQFRRQWDRVRAYAAGRGVGLIGDMPIFVAHDSAEVWAHPELFWLDEGGRAAKVAGVPPDYFSKTGQLWGNPLYRWDVLRARDYAWWQARFQQVFSLFDVIRLDHFIGFHNYWEIPGGAKTAVEGQWVPGPGEHFFERMREKLGGLELIAEDLGVLTDGVKALRDKFGLPGMRVLQFAFGRDPEADAYRPCNYPKRCVVYTGTHDNDTVVGWWRDRGSASSTRSAKDIREEKRFVLRYLGTAGREIHWDMIRVALSSPADLAVVPAQDLLGLDSKGRMNTPGTSEGNWRWRLDRGQPSHAIARRLRDLTDSYARLSPFPA